MNRHTNRKIRVLIVDDHPRYRELLSVLLSEDPSIEVVGEACDGLEAIRRASALGPDVILMDLHMPNCGGHEAASRILKENPKTKNPKRRQTKMNSLFEIPPALFSHILFHSKNHSKKFDDDESELEDESLFDPIMINSRRFGL